MYPHPKRVCNLTGQASPKQIEYAENIHKTLGIDLPREQTKQAYSDYINANVKKYKSFVKQWKLEQEIEGEIRNG